MLGGHAILTLRHHLIHLPHFPTTWQLVVPAQFAEKSALHVPPLFLHAHLGVPPIPGPQTRVEMGFQVDWTQDMRNDFRRLCIEPIESGVPVSHNLACAYVSGRHLWSEPY